jgi:hypothetical protein
MTVCGSPLSRSLSRIERTWSRRRVDRVGVQMSAIGPKQTSAFAAHMSAFGGKADMTSYSTFGKSGQRAQHGSFMLCACFFGQWAVISSSQSISLALPPRSLIKCCTR